MGTLFARIENDNFFANRPGLAVDLNDYHCAITTYLAHYLNYDREITCFSSDQKVLEIINQHSHRSREMILSFEAENIEFAPGQEEVQLKLDEILFEKINFLRPLEDEEYRNSVKFNMRDDSFPKGYIYTPQKMLITKKQIVLNAAAAVLQHLKQQKSTSLFGLNGEMIGELEVAISQRASEVSIRAILVKDRHMFQKTNVLKLFEEKLKDVENEFRMNDDNSSHTTKNARKI